MARLALYPNDAGVTLLDDQRLLYREPGFALVDENGVTLGRAAFENSRIQPLGIQHRYWSALSTAPLADRRFEHLTTADLASQHLETLWRQAGNPSADVVVAVPSYMQGDSLGLLLGIAESLNIRCIAMIDAAVAATRREYVNAVPVHIEMGLHATTLTRLGQQGQAQVEKTEVLDDCGTLALYDAWLNAIAEAFVQQSRFDPLHTAETEQLLLDRLPGWLSEAATRESVRMTIQHASLEHGAELDALSLIAAAAPFYQQIASRLRTLYRAGEVPALQVTDRVARLPGLTDMLKARVGGEVFALEPGATARGALARVTESTADIVGHRTATTAALGPDAVRGAAAQGRSLGGWPANAPAAPAYGTSH